MRSLTIVTLFSILPISALATEDCGTVTWRNNSVDVCGKVAEETEVFKVYTPTGHYKVGLFGLAANRFCKALTGGLAISYKTKLSSQGYALYGGGQFQAGQSKSTRILTSIKCEKSE